ncbi:hypothetical protein L596_025346 [Steinernema carpocapsae]|uniref:SXP/RAL-2 family protein Ani s 5-like cation-binding domain-containing protein n=1 Tax=Steinernema carpocapsae TaxID=34508 RepID=A0A4U5M7I1_STECR|nr:hypothetical protein L596_025346 [Steinernema carpocapsae]
MTPLLALLCLLTLAKASLKPPPNCPEAVMETEDCLVPSYEKQTPVVYELNSGVSATGDDSLADFLDKMKKILDGVSLFFPEAAEFVGAVEYFLDWVPSGGDPDDSITELRNDVALLAKQIETGFQEIKFLIKKDQFENASF